MSNVNKFNETLFSEWSLMTLFDYEKKYNKKFKRTSKNIKKYYEQYEKLYDSDSESSSSDSSEDEPETKMISNPQTSPTKLSTKNKAISSFMGEFNGVEIRQRPSDGYVHATDMCKVNKKKKWNDYYRTNPTKLFIRKLSSDAGIPASELITSIKGNSKADAGTWIHPRIAINLAQWISPEFAVKVTEWVQKFIEGDVSIVKDVIERHDKINNS